MTMIAIEGVIGVGKTSLARYLCQELNASLVLEVFDENPFLSAFYLDRDRYAFQTQMFFLLSRYQQMRNLERLARPLVSDYMFQKDKLFASQTLTGDEMEMYTRIYSALLENTTPPDLIVYLRADTDTLLKRIAIRDRPYERNMDGDYIDGLRVAYDQFFTHYDPQRHLVIETSHLDFVNDEEHRRDLVSRILSRVGAAPHQPNLPGLETAPTWLPLLDADETPAEAEAEEDNDTTADLLFHLMLLQESMGDLSKQLRQQWLSNHRRNQKKNHATLAELLRTSLRMTSIAQVEPTTVREIVQEAL
jgi:deoxyguanosine kinase